MGCMEREIGVEDSAGMVRSSMRSVRKAHEAGRLSPLFGGAARRMKARAMRLWMRCCPMGQRLSVTTAALLALALLAPVVAAAESDAAAAKAKRATCARAATF